MAVFMYAVTYKRPRMGPPENRYGWIPALLKFNNESEAIQFLKKWETKGTKFRNVQLFQEYSEEEYASLELIVDMTKEKENEEDAYT